MSSKYLKEALADENMGYFGKPIYVDADTTLSLSDIMKNAIYSVHTHLGDVTLTLPDLTGLPADSVMYQFDIHHARGDNNVIIKTHTGQTFEAGNTEFILGNHRFVFTLAGTKVSSSIYNWILKRNLTVRATLYRDASWAASNFSSETAIPWDTEHSNNNTELLEWSSSTNPERLTVRTAGSYKLSFGVDIDSTGGSTWNCTATVFKNGVEVDHLSVRSGNYGSEDQSMSFIPTYITLAEDDYIEVRLDQNNLTGNLLSGTLNIEMRL